MNKEQVPGYQIVEDKIKEIYENIVINSFHHDNTHLEYKFTLINHEGRYCDLRINEDFLDDLNDYAGSKTSSYWKKMMSELTSKLIEPLEKKGLIPYTKETLKKLIFEHAKQVLQSVEHINKFNLIGKPYQPGSLEDFLKIKFDDNERAQAGMAFEELKKQGVLIPTYKDLINPEDWVKIGDVGIKKEEGKMATENKKLKAFISYSTKDKLIGAKVKDILGDFGIEGFLAHNDINISEEWKQRIREELSISDIFIPLLSKNFKNSDWASQETGIAYFRDILIIPLRLDETIPFGFMNHLQGKPIVINNIPLNYLLRPILDKFGSYIITAAIERLESAGSFRYAESLMELLAPHFKNLMQADIDRFVDASIKNSQVWSAALCRDKYLPQFIRINEGKIKPEYLKILSYQIEKDERYPHLV